MNKQMEEKLRLACSDAANAFELDPKSFLIGAYAMKDGAYLPIYSRGQVVTDGDRFCALAAVSYLSGYTLGSCAAFLAQSLGDTEPEEFSNEKGREAVIGLLRKAAIRKTATSEAAAK